MQIKADFTREQHCRQCGCQLTSFELATGSLYPDSSLHGLCGNCKAGYIESQPVFIENAVKEGVYGF